ncbi:MAG: hypothetical protein R3344_02740, partial [Acidobacteriota bacterium]|nr:hypothetical protein [Acidobacteriota bacterium]
LAPGAQANVTFYPSIAAQQTYTTNLNFVSDQGEDLSDTITRASVAFPVSGDAWSFLYRPSIQRYRNNSALNHTSHLLQFDWDKQIGRDVDTTLSAFYQTGQASGDPNNLGLDITLNPRADQEVAALSWALSNRITARWSVNGSLQGSVSRIQPIDGVNNGVALVTEDRNAYALSFGASNQISETTGIGVAYFYRHTEGQTSGGEDLHAFSFNGSYKPGRWSGLNYGAGMFTRGDRFDFQGQIGYNRDFQVVNFNVSAERVAGIGGNLVGTSTNTTFALFLGSRLVTSLAWTVSTRYELREGGDENIFGDLETWAQVAALEYRPHRTIGLRFSVIYSDQSGSDLEGLNGNFASATAGLVWYPLGYGRGGTR